MKQLNISVALLSTIFFAVLQSAPAQTDPAKTDPGPCPASWCLPGETLEIAITKPLPDGYQLVSPLTLVSADGSKKLSASFSAKDSPLTISIPKEAKDSTYNIQIQAVKETPKTDTAPAKTETMTVTDLSPTQIQIERPVITAVVPSAAFSDQGINEITILGSGFRDPVQLLMKKYPTPRICKDGSIPPPCYDVEVQSSRQVNVKFKKLKVEGGYFGGPANISLLVGKPEIETNESSLSLINVSHGTPITAAIIGLLLIAIVIFLLLRSGKDATKQIKHGKTYWLSVLFLDVPTDSYSLSKCQFYAWTAASVLGYLYLAISKSFVQGSAIFPDIPAGLPGILLASAGTAVISTGITSAKGDKGAGNPGPNLSDFIATGGVVAADRLQFAVWTLVGIGTFLAIVLQIDPRNISDLPSIPSGFLQLMGISSAGYLAGKLARKAGPTIDAMVVSGAPDQLSFRLTGSGLSRSAKFSIDDQPIFPDTIRGTSNTQGLPDIVQADPTVSDPDFARILSFSVVQTQASWLGGPHYFTITNPDAQKATVPYQVFQVTTDPVLSSGVQSLTLTGVCFDDKLKVICAPAAGGAAIPITGIQVTGRTSWRGTTQGISAGTQYTITVSDTAGVVYAKQVTAT